jgi:hypothetical protein
MVKSGKNFLAIAGAHELADTIRTYWAERGHIVRAWVETQACEEHQRPIFTVRSDLFNGLPPSKRAVAA